MFNLTSGSMIDYYKGSEVTITVESKEYKLPKLLVCHNSTVFNAAFNGTFKESEEQKITLNTSTGVFELAIKWMYTGQLGPQVKTMKNSDYLTQLLEFLTLSDFLGLLGPLDPITQQIRSILSNRANLRSEHIDRAMKQLPGTQAREIILKACVGPYLETFSVFRFKEELKNLDGFAIELFQLFDETVRKKEEWKYGQSKVQDPATGQFLYCK
ncbi:hypothetical protein F5882DRAFT_344366 [Hyaloscypha sp. PMI_1271]|nr:hypothetical protein F5882DRAFT_344366 [Hyaloscypha sp. PMI_1271]